MMNEYLALRIARQRPRPHRCRDLLSYQRVFAHLDRYRYRRLGVVEVALDEVVGSFGRTGDFDLRFRPRNARTREHLARLAAAFARRPPPPVVLYRIGDAYFVEDGNHRVAAARARGQDAIRAVVVAVEPAGLSAEPACTRFSYRLEPTACNRTRFGSRGRNDRPLR